MYLVIEKINNYYSTNDDYIVNLLKSAKDIVLLKHKDGESVIVVAVKEDK